MQDETRESYRKIADHLAHERRRRGVQSVLFTAAEAASGTTTTAIGVAEELQAVAGLQTVLIDFNLRRPAVAAALGLRPERTLADVWAGRCDLLEAVGRTSSGLSVLAAPDPPGGLSLSAALVRRVLDGVEGRFDFVLFDLPPALACADAMVAAGLVPRVVLVVAAGRTPYEALDRIHREFEMRSIDLLGAVLNKHRRFIPGWIYRLFAR